MKYYKLTDENNRTKDTQWGEGVTHEARSTGNKLCSSDVIHVYDHPLKAAIFNSLHADFLEPILWQCKVRKIVANDGLKVGVKRCTTIQQIPVTEISSNQRVRFGILCALAVYKEKTFIQWAKDWLSKKDRTAEAAWAAHIDFVRLIKKAMREEI